MPLKVNSPAWKVRPVKASRGSNRDRAIDLPGMPAEYLTETSRVAEEAILEPVDGEDPRTARRHPPRSTLPVT